MVSAENQGVKVYEKGKWAEIVPDKKKLPKTKTEFREALGAYISGVRTLEEFIVDYED